MEDPLFAQKSRAVWNAMAAGWDQQRSAIAQAGRPVAEALLARLAPADGQQILELAAGTGEVGLAVAARLGPAGRVMLTDFSPAMVEVARRLGAELGLANLECRVMDAEALTLDSASLDGVVCRWGYMLMPHPARALAETRRVLRPGGRAALAVFAEAQRNPWASLAGSVLVAGKHMEPPAPRAPGIFALSDRAALLRLVQHAGFARVEIEEVPHAWTFATAEAYWEFLTGVAGAISMVLGRLDEGARAAVRRELEQRLEPFRSSAGFTLPAVSQVVLAS